VGFLFETEELISIVEFGHISHHQFVTLSDDVRVMQQMMMRWAEYLTHMGEMRSAYRMLTENIK
jgi:hypothetical protein